MAKLNSNLLKLKKNYFFTEIEKRVKTQKQNTNKQILNLGIGDITLPIASSIVDEIQKAALEMKDEKTIQGYGPSEGYYFLRKAIAENDYKNLNIDIDDIFIATGTKYTSANISDLFSKDNIVGICDPTYPVYLDSNIIAGRDENIVLLPLLEKNNFEPLPPDEDLDLIYLCSPNNPIGNIISKKTLKLWIDYAKKKNAIIFFDGAYETFITSKDAIHSIYEIEGAKDVAIEMRSFSKNAGFTSLRCSYIVIPKELKIKHGSENITLNPHWKRYINTKHGGISYPIQKGALASYSTTGKKEVKEIIKTYLENTTILKEGLEKLGFTTYGGADSPYIWCKTPDNSSSWEFFDLLLKKNVICLPGSGFGLEGEGFVRFSGFAKKEIILKALEELCNI